jgi:hypothetical protein
MTNAARFLDSLGPDYPECHVALIDALENYIRCCEGDLQDLCDERSITIEQARTASADILRYKTLLAEMRNHSFDPSLCGLI